MRRLTLSVLRAVPWWLWAEHVILLGFVGWKAAWLWRILGRQKKKPDGNWSLSQRAPQPAPPLQQPSATPSTGLALETLPRDALAALSQIKSLTGPVEVLSWPDVAPAPAAVMDMKTVAEGQALSFRDGRGAIYKFKLAEGVYVNMYYTKAGFRRSGDLHDCNQYDVVLQGRTRLRMIDPHTGREVVQEYGPNDFILIPARTPHMFEFLEDNCLLEWWDDTFRAWYYKPYRTIIEEGLPLQATEGRDFSTRLPPPPPPFRKD